MAGVEPALLRDVMARLASGVSVVTTRHDDRLHGLTVSSACSVSREPPLVLVCIDRLAQSCVTIAASGFYALNIVTRGQMFLADRFAGRGPVIDPAFGGVQYHIAATGAPILEGALAWMDCRVWATYDGGDHVIFVGHVEAAGLGTGADPLVYFDRRYLRVM